MDVKNENVCGICMAHKTPGISFSVSSETSFNVFFVVYFVFSQV